MHFCCLDQISSKISLLLTDPLASLAFRLRVQRYNLFLKPPNFFKVFFREIFRRCSAVLRGSPASHRTAARPLRSRKRMQKYCLRHYPPNILGTFLRLFYYLPDSQREKFIITKTIKMTNYLYMFISLNYINLIYCISKHFYRPLIQ